MITFVFVYLAPRQTSQEKNLDGSSQTFQHQTIRESLRARFYPLSGDIAHIANRKSNGEMKDIILHVSGFIFVVYLIL